MMPSKRRQARILAMQALCQWDVQGESSAAMLQAFFAEQHAGGGITGYATELVEAYWQRKGEIDRAITDSAHRWTLERMSPPERNIMRVAVTEWMTGTVPPKVALSEAIEIGKEYGGAESPQFINGVLDDVYQRLRLDCGFD